MAQELRFLVVDDDEVVRFLRRRELEKAFPECAIVECDSAEKGLVQCEQTSFDAVLTDHKLPEATGTELIADLRARGVTYPLLLVTGNDDPAVHQKAIAAGASRVLSGAKPAFVLALVALLPASRIPSPREPQSEPGASGSPACGSRS